MERTANPPMARKVPDATVYALPIAVLCYCWRRRVDGGKVRKSRQATKSEVPGKRPSDDVQRFIQAWLFEKAEHAPAHGRRETAATDATTAMATALQAPAWASQAWRLVCRDSAWNCRHVLWLLSEKPGCRLGPAGPDAAAPLARAGLASLRDGPRRVRVARQGSGVSVRRHRLYHLRLLEPSGPR